MCRSGSVNELACNFVVNQETCGLINFNLFLKCVPSGAWHLIWNLGKIKKLKNK